jgi:hypothetical protein
VRELGLPQTPVEQGLSEAVQWYSQLGYFNRQQKIHQSREGEIRNGYPI